MTKVEQDNPHGQKGNKDNMHGQKENKPKPQRTEVETQKATITTTKDEVDDQLWYPQGTKLSKHTKTSKIIIPRMIKMLVN